MDFIGSALAHALTWEHCAGFMAALLIGGSARLLWRMIRHD